ncbi:zinc finger, CCHC-type containing protein [Tanacetum coccineum]
MGNNTWVLADLPPGCKPLGCKWIFKRKLKYHKTADCYGINSQSDYSSNGCEDSFLECKFDKTATGVIICLYVDDMLIFGTDQVQVDLTKEFLSSRFSMKDMGEADVILGIKIKHESNRIAISQSHYIENVLKKFNYFDCTLASKKQTCITGSIMESEFAALAAAGKEAEWLKNLLLEIPLWSKPIVHISIRCDSAATLAKAYSQMYIGVETSQAAREKLKIGSVKSSNEPSLNELECELEPKLKLV